MMEQNAPAAQQSDSSGSSGASTTPEKNSADVRTTLAANIARYRQEKKFTRAELAKRVDVTEMAIGQYERGARTPSLDLLCKFSNIFGVTVDALIGHTHKNFDAVFEYRFDKACEFVRGINLAVLEQGNEILVSRPLTRQHFFRVVDHVMYSDPQEKHFSPLMTFADKTAFVAFVENIFSDVLGSLDLQTAFARSIDYMNGKITISTYCR